MTSSRLWLAQGTAIVCLFAAGTLWRAGNAEFRTGEQHLVLWVACYGLVSATYALYRWVRRERACLAVHAGEVSQRVGADNPLKHLRPAYEPGCEAAP
jgi:type VI protein secretion system component VasK